MKKLIVKAFLLAVCLPNCYAQEIQKPRYLKFPTPFCPIDISQQYNIEGVLRGSKTTIEIKDSILKTTPAITEVLIEGKTYKKGEMIPYLGKDTILKQLLTIEKGRAFDIIGSIGSYTLVRFWSFSNSNNSTRSSLYDALQNLEASKRNLFDLKIIPSKEIAPFLKSNAPGKDWDDPLQPMDIDPTIDFYIIPTTALMANSQEFENKKSKWSMGLLVLPAKVRPFATTGGSFDFTGSFNLGATFSYTTSHDWVKDRTFNLLGYVGVTSVNVDTIQSGNTTKASQNNISAFTLGGGIMWKKNGIQISLITGIDFPSGKTQRQRVYRNMPWFGLGFGFSLFKLQSGDNNNSGTNK